MKALAIVATFLTLLFAFLWYSQRSDIESARGDVTRADAERVAAAEALRKRDADVVEISARVGFQSGAFTDPKAIDPHLNLADPTGFLARFKKEAVLVVPKEFWKAGSAEGAKEDKFDVKKFPPELQAKVRELRDARPADVPVPPADDADDAAKAAYASAKAEYDRKIGEYEAKLKSVLESDAAFASVVSDIGPAGVYAIDKPEDLLTVDFFPTPPSKVQLEDIVSRTAPVDQVLRRMRTAFEQNVAMHIATIKALREDVAAKEKLITHPEEAALGLREQLVKEQAAHNADVTRLQQENTELTAKAEGFRVEASEAKNELARTKDAAASEKRRLEFLVSALEEARRQSKDNADLAIRRNDEDGRVLDASTTLGTAYIDLGRVDRVYAGLKFEVYGVGRGGIRELKGTVLVQKVLDAHYSQVTILQTVADSRPIVRGDTVHNPFYDAKKTLHVFLAGDLKKYPKSVAASRLRRANVVIDEVLSAQTDLVVVPDTLTAPVEAAPAGDDGAAPAPAVGTQTPYDRLAAQAKTFGATLVTERQLEAFLDY